MPGRPQNPLRQGHPQEEPKDDVTPIPLFVPSLRGRLTVRSTSTGLLKDIIDSFGGIRFRRLNIFNVGGTELLLGACAETLETLRLHPADLRGKGHSPSNARCRLTIPSWNTNRRCKSVAKQVASDTRAEGGATQRGSVDSFAVSHHRLPHSTIRFPPFPKLDLLYRDADFPG